MSRPFRDEFKYIVHHSVRTALLERWRRHLVKDPHSNEDAVSPILSLYYDSPRLDFYEDKGDGIRFRNKVRLRTYGSRFREGQATFLEIKQRLTDRVRKIRMRVDFRPELLDPHGWTFDNPDDASAFGSLLERYRLRPAVQTYYLREAYLSVVEPDIRVTFDTGLTGLFPGELMAEDTLMDERRRLMPDTLAILEVKSNSLLPRWLTDGALTVELTQRPVPKYVMAVEKLRLLETEPGGAYT